MILSTCEIDRASQRRFKLPNFAARGIVWIVLDAIIAIITPQIAFALSPSYGASVIHVRDHITAFAGSILFVMFLPAAAHVFGLHDPLLPRQRWAMAWRCFGATIIAVVAVVSFIFVVMYSRVGRLIAIQMAVYATGLMIAGRLSIWQLMVQNRYRIVLFGTRMEVQVIESLMNNFDVLHEVVRVVPFPGDSLERSTVNAGAIDEIVLCLRGRFPEEMTAQVMEWFRHGIKVSYFTQFVERHYMQVAAEGIEGEWFLNADLRIAHPVFNSVKRGMDIAAGLFGLALCSPLLLLAIVLIRLESRGGALYSQIRTGQFGRPFKIWKLRSMKIDAEVDGPKWAAANDDRVTRIGALLRKTRLDEVPQFWNILRGEMSLVGPRPERPEMVSKLVAALPFYDQRHLVKPGLTGWAQISYRYGASIEDALKKLNYDLYYVKYSSLGLDLQIILRTVGAVMKGAR